MRSILILFCCFAALRVTAAETEDLYLSGHGSNDTQLWDFFCTAGRNSGVWTRIAVPSCWEQQGFGTYDYGVEFKPSKRMPITLPAPDVSQVYAIFNTS